MNFVQPVSLNDSDSDYAVASSPERPQSAGFSIRAELEAQDEPVLWFDSVPDAEDCVTVKVDSVSAFIVASVEKLEMLNISIFGFFRKIAEKVRCVFVYAVRHFFVQHRIFICSYQL